MSPDSREAKLPTRASTSAIEDSNPAGTDLKIFLLIIKQYTVNEKKKSAKKSNQKKQVISISVVVENCLIAFYITKRITQNQNKLVNKQYKQRKSVENQTTQKRK